MEQKIEISWIEKKFIEYSVAIDYKTTSMFI